MALGHASVIALEQAYPTFPIMQRCIRCTVSAPSLLTQTLSKYLQHTLPYTNTHLDVN